MRVFISWSGERSGQVARELRTWLPRVIQVVRPWLSLASIDPGSRWSDEVADALQELNFGILCLTPENIQSSWLLFEAGALSKAVSEARVVPYLVGIEPHELQGPLAQFQAVRADEEGTLRLVTAINTAAAAGGVAGDALPDIFEVWWPRLSAKLALIAAAVPHPQAIQPKRSLEDMVGEALELLRDRRVPHVPPSSERDEPSRDFAELLRSFRLASGMSQRELAVRSNLSASFISRLEAGILGPSARALNQLAGALGVSVLEFLTPMKRRPEL